MFSLKSFIKGWDEFFFAKTDASALCLFRIFFGLFLFINGISLIEDFYDWFGVGDEALVPLGHSFGLYKDFRINIYRWLSPTDFSAWVVLWAYILSSVGVLVGFKTRISTVICFILLVSMQNRNFMILNSGDTLMRCLLFLMMFAPTHVKYSFDSYLRRKQGIPFESSVSFVTIRLMQLQFSLVYLATTLFKLKGYDWVDGTAVYYTSRLENFQRIVIPFIFDFPSLVKFSTWSALFIEFAMGTLVWVKELRLWVLASGILLHLLIEVSMSIGFFEWVMMTSYLLFFTKQELKWLLSRLIRIFPSRKPSLATA